MPDERRIDLNADVGEADDPDGTAVERELLGLVTTAHVACGGHAGDETTMAATVEAALAAGVALGAHPSYPDREGFGRRHLDISAGDLAASLRQQIASLSSVARPAGATVVSVKPHGALYAEVARGGTACDVLLAVMDELCAPGTALVLAAGAPAASLVRQAGYTVLAEGFCDRAYASDGSLVPRSVPGSVLDDPDDAAAQALGLARDGTVRASDGEVLKLTVDTLCLHGDSPNAAAMAHGVRGALESAGFAIEAARRSA